jgi:hypothetical protein
VSYGCCRIALLNNFAPKGRKGLQIVWKLPYCTHVYLLPLIGQCLPVFDEICRRSLNFVRSCVNHKSDVVRFVACHGITFCYDPPAYRYTNRDSHQYSHIFTFSSHLYLHTRPCGATIVSSMNSCLFKYRDTKLSHKRKKQPRPTGLPLPYLTVNSSLRPSLMASASVQRSYAAAVVAADAADAVVCGSTAFRLAYVEYACRRVVAALYVRRPPERHRIRIDLHSESVLRFPDACRTAVRH